MPKYQNRDLPLSTSISDNQVYPDYCARASLDSTLFMHFRQDPVYNLTLEHVDYDMGALYLEEIKKKNPALLNSIDLFKQNDAWGNPKVFEYKEAGKISPSTLRYLKVYSDLISLFGILDSFHVCEIGVGYGGQCRIVNCLSSPSRYTLIDIKPALMLCQRYLDNYAIKSVLKYLSMNELEVQEYDLVISNYAFTELPREIQDVYLTKIILNSTRGYITYNEISPAYFNSYKKDDLIRIIPGSKCIEEKPLTHAKNCIIVWGPSPFVR